MNHIRPNLVAALWGVALISLMVVALRWAPASAATAGTSASRGGFTLLTGHSRAQEVPESSEIVYLIDHHRGLLLVYGMPDGADSKAIAWLDGGRIEVLFERGRAIGRGSP